MEALKELLYSIGTFCVNMLQRAVEWFKGLSLFNKVIVVNTLISFFAITLPIAKYAIWESYTSINNPLAVYLILIVAIMFTTIFFHGPLVLGGRIVVNLWYFISVIVIHATHAITHPVYTLSIGYFFNLVAPVIYIAAAVMVYLEGDN